MTRPEPRHRKVQRPPYRMLLATGMILVATGGYGLANPWVDATLATPPAVVQEQILEAGDSPVEIAPTKSCRYEVKESEPRRLVIPSLGIDACVQRLGLDQNGAIGAPVNVHVAGWFTGSSRPGQRGLSILDGHNRGASSDGVFVNLHALKVGRRISIEQGNGEALEYVVRSVATHDREVTMERLYDGAARYPEALGIITCAGDWDRAVATRSERVVVIATPVAPS